KIVLEKDDHDQHEVIEEMGEQPMGREEFKGGRKKVADGHDAQTGEHLHRPSALNEQKDPINYESNDHYIKKIDQPHARLKINEQVFHLCFSMPFSSPRP